MPRADGSDRRARWISLPVLRERLAAVTRSRGSAAAFIQRDGAPRSVTVIGVCPDGTPMSPSLAGITTMSTGRDSSSLSGLTISNAAHA